MTEPCDPNLAAVTAPKTPNTLDYVGLAAGMIPFGLSFRSTRTSSMTTTVTADHGASTTITAMASQYTDPIALVGGAIAVVIGLISFARFAKTERAKRPLRIGLSVAIVVLGIVQLVLRSGLLTHTASPEAQARTQPSQKTSARPQRFSAPPDQRQLAALLLTLSSSTQITSMPNPVFTFSLKMPSQ